MIERVPRALRCFVTALLAVALVAQPVAAQSILRDAETEALFHDMSSPLIAAAGLDPRNVNVVLVNDPSINAFATAGQDAYLHSGLIIAADNANEVQGVIAHELGHIAGGHIALRDRMTKASTGITILSLLLGVAAIAAGAGDAGAGILAAGQQAAVGSYLAYSRTQEATTDSFAATKLRAAGVSGKGMISFFKKLQNQEFRYGFTRDGGGYGYDHPLTGDRISSLQEVLASSPAWNTPTDAALEARFQRVKAKLMGYAFDPKDTLARFPPSNTSIPAHYARAYAFHKSAYPDKALAEADGLLASAPKDPYFMELKGQILLESGRPAEALPLLRDAVARTNNQPLISALFGHALIATENPANYDEAKRILRSAIARDNQNPFAWYQLGVVYSQQGDRPRAALASAERHSLQGQARPALANAELAMRGIPQGSPDWLRAQDIAMVSKTQVDEDRRRRR